MAKKLSITIDDKMHGHRIEYVLEKELQISSSLIKRLKREDDGILLNGVRTTVITKVSEGDSLVVNMKGRPAENILPVNIPLNIIWEDEDILVVDKPANMAVHPSRNHTEDTLANAVMYHIGKNEAIHIITRLDRDTSGVVLVAKNPQVAAILTEYIKSGKIKKEYIAIINGIPKTSDGVISAPIKKKAEKGIARCVSEDGKEAVTSYELIKNNEKLSLMRLFPITGRTHQLRVHMSYIGHPIFGDSMYGAPQTNERTRLHCNRLTFIHPVKMEEITLVAMLPEDFSGLM